MYNDPSYSMAQWREAQPVALEAAKDFKRTYQDHYKFLPSERLLRPREIKLNPMDTMRLEAARGLHEIGRLPTVRQYNDAVFTNKLAGKRITHDLLGNNIE
jgi:hypothetical protein